MSHIERQDAPTTTDIIKSNLNSLDVPHTKVREQCYDGCKTMKGAKSVVATKIKENAKALYIHCYGHSSNLAVGDVVNSNKIRNAYDTVHRVATDIF